MDVWWCHEWRSLVEGAGEELSADGSDPAFGERLGDRVPSRRLEDLEVFGSEELVAAFDELAAAGTETRDGGACALVNPHERTIGPTGWQARQRQLSTREHRAALERAVAVSPRPRVRSGARAAGR